jgi:hypothetical protein
MELSSKVATRLSGGECFMEDQNDDTLGNLNQNIVGKPPRDHSVAMRHCTSSSWLADSVSRYFFVLNLSGSWQQSH